MDDLVATFLAVVPDADEATAKQYLEITGGDLEYAVTLYMEGGGSAALAPASPAAASDSASPDAALAQRLQSEAYADVRAADTSVHRHETLVDSFGPAFQRAPQPADMFGAARAGIFNQRFDDAYDDLDSDEDPQDAPHPTLSATQQRLASLFRPPFDIMTPTDLDSAKVEGRRTQKWILVNIQDAAEFQCQVLNRDFWALDRVKAVVRRHFVFLQYQHDSPNGVAYTNFYATSAFPHIAILDPLTGERVRRWPDGEVPLVADWLADVDDFLASFLLAPGLTNPVVHHEHKFDPDALTEEQQIEFAMKQSLGPAAAAAASITASPTAAGATGSRNDPIALDTDDESPASAAAATPAADAFALITARDHPDPPPATPATRVQVRFPNGKRAIHKFALSQPVRHLYEWLKYLQATPDADYGLLPTDRFTLSMLKSTTPLLQLVDSSIEDAGLRNASVLLEKD